MTEILTTKKPWVLLVFALAAINAIIAFGAMIGTDVPMIGELSTQTTIFAVPQTTSTAASPSATALNMGAFFVLILDLVILYGLYKGQTWTWWLLTFTSLSALTFAIFGMLQGTALGVLPFLVNLVLVAALLKKEVITEFKPRLNIIPESGIW